MKNKSFLLSINLIFIMVSFCLLSFTNGISSVEKDIENHTNSELNLKPKSGIIVTMEVSIPDLVAGLVNDPRKQEFKTPFVAAVERSNAVEGNFLDLFVAEFEKLNEGVLIAKHFFNHNRKRISRTSSNSEILTWLKSKAAEALNETGHVIEKRAMQYGLSKPKITYKTELNALVIELPGVPDNDVVRNKLTANALLRFYEVYENKFNGIAGLILQSEPSLSRALYGEELIEVESDDSSEIDPLLATDDELSETSTIVADAQIQKKYPISSLMHLAFRYNETGEIIDYQEGSVVGYANVKDTAELNFRLNHEVMRISLPQDLVFMWDSKELESEGQPNGLVGLHAIKVPLNGPRVDGRDIQSAAVDNRVVGEFGVSMKMNQIGATKWEEMTTDNLNKQVAITMDGSVFSAPVVNGVMNVNSSITGNFTSAEAKDLATLINAGSIPVPVKIVQIETL